MLLAILMFRWKSHNDVKNLWYFIFLCQNIFFALRDKNRKVRMIRKSFWLSISRHFDQRIARKTQANGLIVVRKKHVCCKVAYYFPATCQLNAELQWLYYPLSLLLWVRRTVHIGSDFYGKTLTLTTWSIKKRRRLLH